MSFSRTVSSFEVYVVKLQGLGICRCSCCCSSGGGVDCVLLLLLLMKELPGGGLAFLWPAVPFAVVVIIRVLHVYGSLS